MMGHCFICGASGVRSADGIRCIECGLCLPVDGLGVLIAGDAGDISYPTSAADEILQIEEKSFWFGHRNRVLVAVLDRFVPKAAVWDVGGGNGYQAKKLQDLGRDVVLVEPGIAGTRNAIARGVRNVVRGSLDAIRAPDRSIPVITLLDVIEHLADPLPLLRECRRILRDDGCIVVMVPAHRALWSDEDVFAEHHRRYDDEVLRSHLAAAGLETIWSSHFFAPLVVPIFLLRAIPYRVFRRRRANTSVSEHDPNGYFRSAIDALLARELRSLQRGKRLSFGSSIVAVASRAASI